MLSCRMEYRTASMGRLCPKMTNIPGFYCIWFAFVGCTDIIPSPNATILRHFYDAASKNGLIGFLIAFLGAVLSHLRDDVVMLPSLS